MDFLRLDIVIVLILVTLFGGALGKLSEQEILNKLFKDYNPEVRDGENGTTVSVNMYIRNFDSFDDVKMEYSVQLTFRQQWKDQRLAFNRMDMNRDREYITLLDTKKIWIPDLFFSNEKSSRRHDLLKPNTYVRIFPGGDVLYSMRISLTLSCPMILKLFPFDKQTCSLRMASYGYTNQDIIFKWKEDDPVQVTPNLHLPSFAFEQFTTDYCDSQTNTGVYSCLRVDFLLKRDLSQYLTQVFIPCISMVIMAWLSFWLSTKEVVGRLLLTLVTYLIMVIGIIYLNLAFPKVSYTKAIDVWTGSCLSFVFFALAEFILVNYLTRHEESQMQNSSRIQVQEERKLLNIFNDRSLSEKLDIACRILYPILFIIFGITYMTTYCHSSED